MSLERFCAPGKSHAGNTEAWRDLRTLSHRCERAFARRAPRRLRKHSTAIKQAFHRKHLELLWPVSSNMGNRSEKPLARADRRAISAVPSGKQQVLRWDRSPHQLFG